MYMFKSRYSVLIIFICIFILLFLSSYPYFTRFHGIYYHCDKLVIFNYYYYYYFLRNGLSPAYYCCTFLFGLEMIMTYTYKQSLHFVSKFFCPCQRKYDYLFDVESGISQSQDITIYSTCQFLRKVSLSHKEYGLVLSYLSHIDNQLKNRLVYIYQIMNGHG